MEQKTTEIEERIKRLQKEAAERLPKLTPLIEEIFGEIPLNVSYRIKTRGSIIKKCIRKNLNPEELTDILGVRIICASKYFIRVLHRIFNNFDIKEIEDYWYHPTSLGYRSLHILIEVDNFVVELQIHTAISMAYALLCHEIYKSHKIKKEVENATLFLRKRLESEAQEVNHNHLALIKCTHYKPNKFIKAWEEENE